MNLSDAQKEAVGVWVAEGLKLSDIQSRIQESFGITLTYMDARFLLDDLNLNLKEQPKPVDNDLRNAPPAPSPESGEENAFDESEEDSLPTGGAGLVSVTLHRIYKPGSVVSGDVVFSDGEKADWALDQIGRLALNPATKGYQPGETDIQEFQKELSALLQSRGF